MSIFLRNSIHLLILKNAQRELECVGNNYFNSEKRERFLYISSIINHDIYIFFPVVSRLEIICIIIIQATN